MSQTDISKKPHVFAPHQLLHEGTTYIKVDKFDYIIAIKTIVKRVELVKETGGQPVIDPTGKPMALVSSTPDLTLLTFEEFEKIQRSSLGMG